MASVHDVAAYILKREGKMSTMKLQKLCFYAQAWHMVWEDVELFQEDFQAWANGPVCRDLYDEHRGKYSVRSWESGDPAKLTKRERDNIRKVVKFYGKWSGQQLGNLTHKEHPWKHARRGLPAGARSTEVIEKTSMADYYGSL